jgi:hypothetical protein
MSKVDEYSSPEPARCHVQNPYVMSGLYQFVLLAASSWCVAQWAKLLRFSTRKKGSHASPRS